MEFDNEHVTILVNNTMKALDQLPQVDSFLGTLDLKTGSMIISALCVLHPTIYGCTLFMPVSYLLLTIWFLLALFFATSILLFYGLTNVCRKKLLLISPFKHYRRIKISNDIILISTWICYSLLFVVTMFLMMFLLGLFFITKDQKIKAFIVFLGILWYIITIYFILVVNSHRKVLVDAVVNSKTGSSSKLIDSKLSLRIPNFPVDTKILDAIDDKDPLDIKDRIKAIRKASGNEKGR